MRQSAFAAITFWTAATIAQAPLDSAKAAQAALSSHDWRTASTRASEAVGKASSDSDRAAALLLEAKAEVHLPDLAKADDTIAQLMKLRPNSAEVLYLRGFLQQRQNRPADSLETFTRAAALQPPTGDDLKLVALDYVLLDDYADALHWLERAVAQEPDNAEAWYDLGRARMHQGQFPEAEAAFQHVLKLEPNHVKALDNLGLTLEAQNRNPEALTAYQRAIGADATSSSPSEQPLLNKGALLNTEGGYEEAARLLHRATTLAPQCAHCFEELARADAGLHQPAQAAAAMERAAELDPQNARLHFQLGRLYKALGRTTEAQAEFDRSSRLYGTHSSEPQH